MVRTGPASGRPLVLIGLASTPAQNGEYPVSEVSIGERGAWRQRPPHGAATSSGRTPRRRARRLGAPRHGRNSAAVETPEPAMITGRLRRPPHQSRLVTPGCSRSASSARPTTHCDLGHRPMVWRPPGPRGHLPGEPRLGRVPPADGFPAPIAAHNDLSGWHRWLHGPTGSARITRRIRAVKQGAASITASNRP